MGWGGPTLPHLHEMSNLERGAYKGEPQHTWWQNSGNRSLVLSSWNKDWMKVQLSSEASREHNSTEALWRKRALPLLGDNFFVFIDNPGRGRLSIAQPEDSASYDWTSVVEYLDTTKQKPRWVRGPGPGGTLGKERSDGIPRKTTMKGLTSILFESKTCMVAKHYKWLVCSWLNDAMMPLSMGLL